MVSKCQNTHKIKLLKKYVSFSVDFFCHTLAFSSMTCFFLFFFSLSKSKTFVSECFARISMVICFSSLFFLWLPWHNWHNFQHIRSENLYFWFGIFYFCSLQNGLFDKCTLFFLLFHAIHTIQGRKNERIALEFDEFFAWWICSIC